MADDAEHRLPGFHWAAVLVTTTVRIEPVDHPLDSALLLVPHSLVRLCHLPRRR
jgi:hypothetical protein